MSPQIDHILDKALRQLAVLLQQAREAGKLLRRRQIAEQQQPDDLLKAEAVLRGTAFDEVADIDAAVKQPALRRAALVRFHNIAVDIADARDAGQHAGAVRVAQAALDVILLIGVLGDRS